MKTSKRILASVMSALLILPSFALPFSGTAEGEEQAPAVAYPNADPNEPFYVVGKLQDEDLVAESTVSKHTGTNSAGESVDYLWVSSNERSTELFSNASQVSPIDLSAYNNGNRDNLAIVVDIKISAYETTFEPDAEGSKTGTITKTDTLTDADKFSNDIRNSWLVLYQSNNQSFQVRGSNGYIRDFTSDYKSTNGKKVQYVIPWQALQNKDAELAPITGLRWYIYNDTWKKGSGTTDADKATPDQISMVDAEISNAKIVDLSRDGEGYKNGLVALYAAVPITASSNKNNIFDNGLNTFPEADPLVTFDTKADISKLALKFDIQAEPAGCVEPTFNYDGDGNPTSVNAVYTYGATKDGAVTGLAKNLVNNAIAFKATEGPDYKVNSWSNNPRSMTGNLDSYIFPLTDFKIDGNGDALDDYAKLAGKLRIQEYNDNFVTLNGETVWFSNQNNPTATNNEIVRIGGNQPANTARMVLPMQTTISNVMIVDTGAFEAREALKAAVGELKNALFDEDDAAKVYDEAVAEGEALLVDRDATDETLNAATNKINTAKAALTGIVDTTYEVVRFSSQEETKTKADVGEKQFYYNWASGDGLSNETPANLTDGKENVVGANRYFQLTVTLAKNAAYTGDIVIDNLDILGNVQVRLQAPEGARPDGIAGECRSDSFTMTVLNKDTSDANKVVYTLEGLMNDETENKGDRKDMNWTKLVKSIIFVNLTEALREKSDDNEIKQAPVPVACTLSDVKIVNKTQEVLKAELAEAANVSVEGYAENDALTAFHAEQATAKDLLAGDPAIRAVKAEITKLAELKAALTADKADLKTLLDQVAEAAGDSDKYTPASVNTLTAAYEAGNKVYEDEDATPSDVKEAIDKLNEAIDALKEKGDKTDLADAITTAETKVEADYTEESWATFKSALKKANDVNADENATQDEVDEALKALNDAITALVPKQSETVDKTKLEAKIAEVEALKEDDYTEASWGALIEKLKAANEVVSNDNATQNDVDTALADLNAAKEALVKAETPVDDSIRLTIETPTATGHTLSVSQTFAETITLNADKEAFLEFKLKLDKLDEDFPATIKDEWGDWLNYIRNGHVIVNGQDIGDLNATNGLLKDIQLGQDCTVSVKIPQTLVEQGITSVQFLMYNDLHNFAKEKDPDNEANYTEQNEGSHGVQLSVSDVKIVPGADVEKPDPDARMVWSAVKGDETTLLDGKQVYVDWKAADGCSKDTVDGGGVDLSGTATNGANKNYYLQVKFSFKDVTLPDGVENVEQLIKQVFVRLRSTRISGAEQAAEGQTFTLDQLTKLEGDEYFINIPLSTIAKENINWNDVKELIFRMELNSDYFIKDESGNEVKGRVDNPYFTLNISEARVYDTDPDHPDEPTPVNTEELEQAIAEAEDTLKNGKVYTAETLETLNDKLTAAKAALTSTDQDEIDAAADELKTAIEGLKIAYGDVNGDGKIDIIDALMALQKAANQIGLDDNQEERADVDGAEGVSAADALLILKVATGALDKTALPLTAQA